MSRLNPTAERAVASAAEGAASFSLAHMPGHLVRRVQQVAVRLFAEIVTGDLTPVQYAALAALAERPRVGQAQLASMIGYDRATLGGVVDRLEAKGLVVRNCDPDDRRSNILDLTEDGRKILQAANEEVQVVQDKLLAALDHDERRQFEKICIKILSANGG